MIVEGEVAEPPEEVRLQLGADLLGEITGLEVAGRLQEAVGVDGAVDADE